MNYEKIYTAADFASYHAGTMPAHDMHALEKAALEDPFLADALEGYVHANTAVADVESLKGKLATKEKNETKVFALSSNKIWMRAAASIAIVLGLGFLFYTVNKKDDITTPLAKNEIKQEIKIDTAASEKSNTDVTNNAPQVPTASGTITTVKPNTITFTDVHSNFDSTTSSLATNEFSVTPGTYIQQTPAAPVTAKVEEAAEQADWEKSVQKNADDKKSKEVFKELNLNNRAQNNGLSYYNYSGVVQNPAGGPMQNATIKLKNTNIATQTDNKGRFNFKATDSVASVSIAAVGYDRKDALLNSNASQILRLDNKNSNLDEVVVTSMGTKSRRSSEGYSTTTISEKALAGKVAGVNVTPQYNDKYATLKKVKGIQIDSSKYNLEAKSFYSFVKQNIKPEFDEYGNEYKGNVVLSFTVNKKGDTRKIKVEKSLNEKCDAQAIQLLETGPSWYFPAGERRTAVIEF